MSKRQLIIILGSLIIIVLGSFFLRDRALHEKVQAVGDLIFTFNGLPPNAPVFSVNDLKPGDCYTRPVAVQNDGVSPASITVKADQINNPDHLSDILYLTITEGAATLYGGGNSKSVSQFFLDSTATVDGLALSSLPAGGSTTYQFLVCMPPEAGNEWQKTQLVFDLLFGQNKPPDISVPPECQALAGTIKHVFTGTEGADTIHGTVENDLILGLGGNDWLDGSGGNDCVIGGAGDDYIRSEDGNDIIVGGLGNDTLIAGSGTDIIYGNEGNDTIETGSDNDLVYAGDGNDLIDAGTGDDYVLAGTGNDNVVGKTGNDQIYGGEGNDILDGGSGVDQLYGEAGNDTLTGGSGNDYLDGGAGSDNMNGQTGNDTCLNGETNNSCEL